MTIKHSQDATKIMDKCDLAAAFVDCSVPWSCGCKYEYLTDVQFFILASGGAVEHLHRGPEVVTEAVLVSDRLLGSNDGC